MMMKIQVGEIIFGMLDQHIFMKEILMVCGIKYKKLLHLTDVLLIGLAKLFLLKAIVQWLAHQEIVMMKMNKI